MVLVQGTKIVAVGTDLAIPAGAEVIDLGDATLSPGFIDAHTHLTGESTDDWKQGFVDRFRRELAEKAIESTVHARKVLEAGFTTVRDVGSEDLLDVGLRNAIARGLVPGPRMLVSVHALGARGGHADETGLRHDLLVRELGPAEGIAHGPDGLPRGGPLPGQVRRRRDQVLRLRRRPVAGRRGGHAATDPRGDERPGR